MELKVLVDNRTNDTALQTEHGLCVYFDNDQVKCLLDTGASDLFIQNAKYLNIDLTEVDYVFISHGHLDHIGGLYAFLQINSKAKVIISKHALNQQYYSIRNSKRNISNKTDLSAYYHRFVFVDNTITLAGDIQILYSQTSHYTKPKANTTLLKMIDDVESLDDFNHELIFVSATEKHSLVYAGCAHKGVLNIMDNVQQNVQKPIETLIGGFHLLDGDFETADELTAIANTLKTNWPNTHFITGHCTGDLAFKHLQETLGNNITNFYTGYTL